MPHYYTEIPAKSPRIQKLIDHLYAKMPEIESDRAVLLTEVFKKNRGRADYYPPGQSFCRNLQKAAHYHSPVGADCWQQRRASAQLPGVS